MEKNTPKKAYGAQSLDNNSTCRLCKSVGDPAHRYNLYSNVQFVETQSTLTKFKRLSKDSPGSMSHPSKCLKTQESRLNVQSRRARQRLDFTGKEVSYI